MVKRLGLGLVVMGLVAGAPMVLRAEDAPAAAPTATVSAERRPEVKPEASRRHWFRRHERRAEDRRDARQQAHERLGNADIRPVKPRAIHHHRRREANADSPEAQGREFRAERLRHWVQQHHDDPKSVYEWLHAHPDSEYTQNWYKPGVLGDGELLKLAPYLSATELKQLQDAQPNVFPQALEAWKQAHPNWQERLGRDEERHDLGNAVVNTDTDPRVVADRIENSNLSREDKQHLLRRLYNTTHDPNAPEDINPRALIERITNSDLPPDVKRHMIGRVTHAYEGEQDNPERRLHRREEVREHRERLEDVLGDRRDIRRDERDLRGDRRDLQRDIRTGDRGDFRRDVRDLRDDRRDLRRDDRDFRRDVGGRPSTRPEAPRRSLGDRIGGLNERGFGGGGVRGGDRGGFGGGGGRSGGGRSSGGGGGRR